MKNKGFSLVELIVVIAIMAILVGVAVPVYTSYIEKSQKAKDIQMVDEVVHAIQIANAADPLEGTVAIIFYSDGTSAVIKGGSSESEAWITTALTGTFGSSCLADLKLSYGNWGNGALVAADVVAYFSSVSDAELSKVMDGTYSPSFANSVDDLFVMVKDTATSIAGSDKAADLVKGAANTTTGVLSDAGDFATKWAEGAWDSSFIMGDNSAEYDGSANELQGDALDQAVANAAVIKARNTALAGYLRDNGFPELYDVFVGYNYGSSIVPRDAYDAIYNYSDEGLLVGLIDGAIANRSADDQEKAFVLIENYLTEPEADGKTAAYKDGLAYYAMLGTVKEVEGTSEETYWDEMADAVKMYGSIARGETTLEDLSAVYQALDGVTGNAVVVTVMGEKGNLIVNVSPVAALGD